MRTLRGAARPTSLTVRFTALSWVAGTSALLLSACTHPSVGDGDPPSAPDLLGAGDSMPSPTGTSPFCVLSGTFVNVGDVGSESGPGPQFESVTTLPARVDPGAPSTGPQPGTVWVLGTGVTTQSTYWLARKSTDGGATWSQIDSFLYQGDQMMGSPRLYGDDKQGLLVSGWVRDQNGVERWVVQGSNTQGQSFSVSESYAYAPGKAAVPTALRGDARGLVYATGFGTDAADTRHWVVRRSRDVGKSWELLDDFIYFGGMRAEANDLAGDSTGALYAVGFGNDGKGNTSHHWLVRRSRDRGASWNTLEDYQLAAGQQAIPYNIFVDGRDNLYVTGIAEDAGQTSHFIVRRSTNRGQSFTTVDDFQYVQGQDSFGLSLQADSFGVLYAVGEGKDAGGISHLIVRRSDNGGDSWTVTDDYAGPDGSGAAGRGLARGPLGDLFAAGFYFDKQKTQHGLVRKLSCQ